MRNLFIAPIAGLAILGLAACATSPTGKPVVSTAVLGAAVQQAGNVINLAADLNDASPKPVANVSADLRQAGAGVLAVGVALQNSGAVSGDLQANVNLAFTAFNALVAGANATGDAGTIAIAAKAKAYEATLVTMLDIYDTGAAADGLPTIAVPAAAQ